MKTTIYSIAACVLALGLGLFVSATNCRADAEMTWTNGSDFYQSSTAWTTNLCDIETNGICPAGGTGGWPGVTAGVPDDAGWFTNATAYTVTVNADIDVDSNIVANASGTVSTVTFDLNGHQFNNRNTLTLGYRANSISIVYIGSETNTSNISNTDSHALLFSSGGNLTVARNGNGTMYVTNGVVDAAAVVIGGGSGGQGTLVLSGTNVTFWFGIGSGGFAVGGVSNSFNNSVIVTNGAILRNRTAGTFRFGSGAGQANTSNNTMMVVGGGQLIMGSGSISIGNGSTFTFPGEGSFNNLMTIGNGGTFNCGGDADGKEHTLFIGSSKGTPSSNNVLRVLAGGMVRNLSQVLVSNGGVLEVFGGTYSGTLSNNVMGVGGTTTNHGIIRGWGYVGGSLITSSNGLLACSNQVASLVVSNSFVLDTNGTMQIGLGTSCFPTIVTMSDHSNTVFKLFGTLNFVDSGGFTGPNVYPLFTFNTSAVGFITNNLVTTTTQSFYSVTTATIGTVPNPVYVYTLDTNTFGVINLDVTCTNCVAVSGPFQIISIARSGNDVALKWVANPGKTNIVQVTPGTGNGSYTNNYVNLSGQLPISVVTNTYTDVGGGTNKPARYYRVVQIP